MNTRLVVVVGLCFGLGTGSGATWSATKTAAARDALQQAAGDSTAVTHEAEPAGGTPADHAETTDPGDSASPGTVEPGDTTPVATPATEPAPDPVTDSSAMSPPAADSARPAQTASPADSADAGAQNDAGRPSRIFGAMRPEQAARILEALDDSAALSVLLGLTDRKAAAILSNIKGERATSLARALLNHEGVR